MVEKIDGETRVVKKKRPAGVVKLVEDQIHFLLQEQRKARHTPGRFDPFQGQIDILKRYLG